MKDSFMADASGHLMAARRRLLRLSSVSNVIILVSSVGFVCILSIQNTTIAMMPPLGLDLHGGLGEMLQRLAT
jgi:hypothetical protein